MKRNAFSIVVATLCVAEPGSAHADVTLSLAASVQNSARGATLTFFGTITNSSTTVDVCLNGVDFALASDAGVQLLPGTNVFFGNVPGILLPGESYTGELFEASLDAAAPTGDYAGTATLKGGGDQLVNGSLATADFAVLSPAVSIAATDASASEYGPDAGVVTAARTGRTDIPLIVPLKMTGSAVEGVAYESFAPNVVIPAGSFERAVTILPMPDTLAQGDRIATFTVDPTAYFNTGALLSADVVIHDLPADAWRFAHFGAAANTPAAADAADWNNDGIANQLAYALDIDPVGYDPGALPVATIDDGYYTLTHVPNPAAVDMILTTEASTDLATWSAADVEAVPAPPGHVAFRYRIPAGLAPRVFLRLRAQRRTP